MTAIRRLTEDAGVALIEDPVQQRLRVAVRREVVAFLADLADSTRQDRAAGVVAYNAALTYPAGSIGAALKALQTGVGAGTPWGDINALVTALTGLLGPTQLTADLQGIIALIDAPGSGLVDQVADLTTTFGTTVSAANSAAAAATAATNATQARVDAVAASAAAEVAAGQALTSQTAAAGSATTAQTLAGQASVSADQAAVSATSAAGAAADAQASAVVSATSASQSGLSATASSSSAQSAETAATAASTSASAAAQARVDAQSAAGNATVSATNAASSATSAAGSATIASNQATLAATAANDAGSAASSAAESSMSASSSADNAATSASAASSSRVLAEAASAAAGVSSGSAATAAAAAGGSAAAAASHYANTVAATGALSGQVAELQQVVVGPNGVTSQWVLKVAATRPDGKKVFSAIGLGATASNDTGESQILLQAGRLLFVPDGDLNATPVNLLSVGVVDGVTTLVVPAARIGDTSIGPGKLSVNQLSAISALLGNVRIDAAGSIKQGMLAYGDAPGLFIGFHNGEHTLLIGDKIGGSYMEYKPSLGLRIVNPQLATPNQPAAVMGNHFASSSLSVGAGTFTVTSSIEFRRDGTIWSVTTASNGSTTLVYEQSGLWFGSVSAAAGDDFDIRFDLDPASQTANYTSSAAGAWQQLSSTQYAMLSRTSTTTTPFLHRSGGVFTLRRRSSGQQVGSGSFAIDIER